MFGKKTAEDGTVLRVRSVRRRLDTVTVQQINKGKGQWATP